MHANFPESIAPLVPHSACFTYLCYLFHYTFQFAISEKIRMIWSGREEVFSKLTIKGSGIFPLAMLFHSIYEGGKGEKLEPNQIAEQRNLCLMQSKLNNKIFFTMYASFSLPPTKTYLCMSKGNGIPLEDQGQHVAFQTRK